MRENKSNFIQFRDIFKKIKAKEQRRCKKTLFTQIAQISLKPFELTSRNFHELINYDQHIREVFKKTFMFNDFKKTLRRRIKESTVSTYFLKLAKTKLKKIKSYQKVKTVRNRLPNIVINKLNVVMISMIRVMKRKYKKDIIEIAQKAIRIAKTKLKRKRKKCEKERLKS